MWRVIHSGSQSSWDGHSSDLVAADSTRELPDIHTLRQAAEDHFDWKCREPSCFLSVFFDEKHAHNWAKKRATKSGGFTDEIWVYEIDPTMLPAGSYIFQARTLARDLRIADEASEHELLFLHRIPGQAVVGSVAVPVLAAAAHTSTSMDVPRIKVLSRRQPFLHQIIVPGRY